MVLWRHNTSYRHESSSKSFFVWLTLPLPGVDCHAIGINIVSINIPDKSIQYQCTLRMRSHRATTAHVYESRKESCTFASNMSNYLTCLFIFVFFVKRYRVATWFNSEKLDYAWFFQSIWTSIVLLISETILNNVVKWALLRSNLFQFQLYKTSFTDASSLATHLTEAFAWRFCSLVNVTFILNKKKKDCETE